MQNNVNIQLKTLNSTRKFSVRDKDYAKNIRKSRRDLNCFGINERAPLGQSPTQLSFQLVERKGLRNFLLLTFNNKGKGAANVRC